MKVRILVSASVVVLVSMTIWGIFKFNRPTEPSSQPPIPNAIWQLDYITIGEERQYPLGNQQLNNSPIKQIRVVAGNNPEIKGFDGCNSFRGTLDYSSQNGTFILNHVNMTANLCVIKLSTENKQEIENSIVADELSFLEALGKSKRYELSKDILKLYSKDESQIMVFITSTEEFHYMELPAPIP